MFQYLAQDWSLRARAIHNFCVDLGAAGLFQSIDLQINGLIFRANPGVASFHIFSFRRAMKRSTLLAGLPKIELCFLKRVFQTKKRSVFEEKLGFDEWSGKRSFCRTNVLPRSWAILASCQHNAPEAL
jgi:hypothetical protein